MTPAMKAPHAAPQLNTSWDVAVKLVTTNPISKAPLSFVCASCLTHGLVHCDDCDKLTAENAILTLVIT